VFYGDRKDKPDWPYSALLEELRDGQIHNNYYGICHTLSLLKMRELRDGKLHNNYGISHTFSVTFNVGT
jgi:hypothetical protein